MRKCIHVLLHKSVKNQRLFIIEKLATHDPFVTGNTPCKCGKNKENHNNLTYAFFIACYENNLNCVKKILEINEKILAIYGRPQQSGKSAVNKYAIDINAIFSYYSDSSLSSAVSNGNVALVRLLIANGAIIQNSTKDIGYPLRQTCQKGQYTISALLIKVGADVNEQDAVGNTAIFYAAEYKQIKIAKLLVKAGANVNIQNNKGRTPIFSAISSNTISIINYLIQNGANVNVQEKNHGYTPLIYFIKKFEPNIQIINTLVKNGANLDIQDIKGNTALYYAISFGDYNAAHILIKDGANIYLMDNKGSNMFEILEKNYYSGDRNKIIDLVKTILSLTTNHIKLKSEINKTDVLQHFPEFKSAFNIFKILDKNVLLILANQKDTGSLIYKDYFPKDLFNKILQEANFYYYFSKYDCCFWG